MRIDLNSIVPSPGYDHAMQIFVLYTISSDIISTDFIVGTARAYIRKASLDDLLSFIFKSCPFVVGTKYLYVAYNALHFDVSFGVCGVSSVRICHRLPTYVNICEETSKQAVLSSKKFL